MITTERDVPFALVYAMTLRHDGSVNRGILPIVTLMLATTVSACSSGGAGPPTGSSSPTMSIADKAHVTACADSLVQTSGHATSIVAYPTAAETLRQGSFISLPITQAVSGEVILVWMKGSFTDPVMASGSGDASLMWMVIPAGSPTAPCPTDDVGIGADPRIDPSVLGTGVPIS